MSIIEEGEKETGQEGQQKYQKQGEHGEENKKSCINYRTKGSYKCIKKRMRTVSESSTSACFFC